MLTLQALSGSLNAGTAKRGCLGQGEAFGWPPAVCPSKLPRPFAHYRLWATLNSFGGFGGLLESTRFRVGFESVTVPVFGGFLLRNPINKASSSKLFFKGISLSEYGSEGFRRLRRLSEYSSVVYLVETTTRETQAEQYSNKKQGFSSRRNAWNPWKERERGERQKKENQKTNKTRITKKSKEWKGQGCEFQYERRSRNRQIINQRRPPLFAHVNYLAISALSLVQKFKSRRRTNVATTNVQHRFVQFFLLSFLFFCSHWARTLCFEGESPGGKILKKCDKLWKGVKIMKQFCPLVVAL